MANLEFKVGDEVKYQEENSLLVRYGTIVGVYKVNVRIEEEDGEIILISKRNVWFD